ncbi:hypothetical protein FALCPG4_016267 [Fusarium falciforme]
MADDLVTYDTRRLPSFSVPHHPENRYCTYLYHRLQGSGPPRFSRLQYNQSRVTGISIYCDPSPIAFHAHKSNEDLSFYQSSPEGSVWVYMPLEPDERITRIWMRARSRLNGEVALAFETDRGYVKLFGTQSTPPLTACQWILLDTPRGSPGHFFFDNHPHGIRHISLDTLPPKQTPGFAAPAASSDYPNLHSTDDFLWSCASVENVVAVRPCRRQTGDLVEILGLLLYYSDGKQAPVGQIRFDYLDQPILTHGCQLIYLGFEKTDTKGPFVSRGETCADNLDHKVSMWFEVSLKGALEW